LSAIIRSLDDESKSHWGQKEIGVTLPI